jgi:hypothetical protein
MATIMDLGDGRFIAGDPPAELREGEHWCQWCAGSGLEYDWDDTLTTCGGCWGAAVLECTDTACPVHSSLHPQ